MCGRYQLDLDLEALETLYALQRRAWPRPPVLPRLNVAPRQSVPVVVLDPAQGRVGRTMRWGFPPQWVRRQGKEPFDAPPLVNARGEDAADKPTWREALATRRCLVPSTGFYEWLGAGAGRRPVHIGAAGGGPLTFAGLWGAFDWGEKKDWPCMAIVTCTPNAEVATLHDRMPVVLDAEQQARWLDPAADPAELAALLAPAPNGSLRLRAAHTALNHWSAEDPSLREADWEYRAPAPEAGAP
jgi:putative SOS response-associated peptidase YedK